MAVEPELADGDPPHRGAGRIDLSASDDEPIHAPGSIQPHGLLLVADRARQTVVGGAGAIEERLTPVWLGRPLGALLAQSIDQAVAEAEAAPGTIVPLSAVPGRREAFDASLFVSGDHLLVELEPRPENMISAGAVLSRLDAIGTGFERANDLQALCDRAAAGFRALTGFDRVMIYRFLDDAAAVVVAEDRDPALPSFLDHHFPASDIPRRARELAVRNRVRVIPDAAYAPAVIRSKGEDLGGLDLSDAALRSVSPIHLEYLRNMGIAASASISIVKDGLLWGLAACHHRRPREMGYELRAACRALAGALARQIGVKEEAETYRERIRLRQAEDAVISRFDQDAPFDRFFETMAEDLRGMLDADGFAAIQGSRIVTAGKVPGEAELKELARWLGPRTTIEPYATAVLGERFPPAIAYREVASGVLGVLLTTEVSTLMLWFRAGQAETVRWAGNPHKDEDPGATPTPRASFEAWRETVRARARRWTLSEMEAANRLRRSLFTMRQSQRLRELNRELGVAVAEREALIAQKDRLQREMDRRVESSLQLVQAVLALQSRDAPGEVAEHLAGAQRRLAAIALVHRRLYQADEIESVDLGRYLHELVGDVRQAMGGEWLGAITTDLAPIAIPVDRAIPLGLILTELVVDAQKYAYGGRPGPIAVTLERYRSQFRLIVADQGAGPKREGERFGARMVRAMAERLGGTVDRHDNRPGLRVVLTAPAEI